MSPEGDIAPRSPQGIGGGLVCPETCPPGTLAPSGAAWLRSQTCQNSLSLVRSGITHPHPPRPLAFAFVVSGFDFRNNFVEKYNKLAIEFSFL